MKKILVFITMLSLGLFSVSAMAGDTDDFGYGRGKNKGKGYGMHHKGRNMHDEFMKNLPEEVKEACEKCHEYMMKHRGERKSGKFGFVHKYMDKKGVDFDNLSFDEREDLMLEALTKKKELRNKFYDENKIDRTKRLSDEQRDKLFEYYEQNIK